MKKLTKKHNKSKKKGGGRFRKIFNTLKTLKTLKIKNPFKKNKNSSNSIPPPVPPGFNNINFTRYEKTKYNNNNSNSNLPPPPPSPSPQHQQPFQQIINSKSLSRKSSSTKRLSSQKLNLMNNIPLPPIQFQNKTDKSIICKRDKGYLINKLNNNKHVFEAKFIDEQINELEGQPLSNEDLKSDLCEFSYGPNDMYYRYGEV